MTPSPEAVAALARALWDLVMTDGYVEVRDKSESAEAAENILAALPEGWALVDMEALVERVAEGIWQGDSWRTTTLWDGDDRDVYRAGSRRLLGLDG